MSYVQNMITIKSNPHLQTKNSEILSKMILWMFQKSQNEYFKIKIGVTHHTRSSRSYVMCHILYLKLTIIYLMSCIRRSSFLYTSLSNSDITKAPALNQSKGFRFCRDIRKSLFLFSCLRIQSVNV